MLHGRYVEYLDVMVNQDTAYKSAFNMIWNITGKASKELDAIVERNFEQNAMLARKINKQTFQSIRETIAHTTTIGMQVYASVSVVEGLQLSRSYEVNVARLVDVLMEDSDLFNRILTRYGVMPIIVFRRLEAFNELLRVEPQLGYFTFNEVAEVQGLYSSATELSYALTLASFEKL
jgi:hypothetical protein